MIVDDFSSIKKRLRGDDWWEPVKTGAVASDQPNPGKAGPDGQPLPVAFGSPGLLIVSAPNYTSDL